MIMTRKTNIVKMSLLPNLTYRSSAIAIKIPASYFVILKFMWDAKRLRIARAISKEKNKARRLTLPDLKLR